MTKRRYDGVEPQSPSLGRMVPILFLLVTVALVVIGIIMSFSTGSVAGYAEFNDPYHYVKRHLIYTVIGIVAFIFGVGWPIEFYKKRGVIGLGFSIFLLVLVFLPGIGVKLGGARRWLNLGVIQLQPVEITKFFVSVILALSFSNKKDQLKNFAKGIFPILAVVCVPVALLGLQPDLGNAVVMLGVFFTLLFLSQTRWAHWVFLGGFGFLAVILSIVTHPYQLDRLSGFLFPWDDPMGKSYHIVQSFIAIGSGGLFGVGLGQSKMKYFYLPLHFADFIYSIICEEGGFIFGGIVAILFFLFLVCGCRISTMAQDDFSKYLGMSLTLFIAFQGLINMGVVTGILPITGIPLTFISFGGTSLIMSMFSVGVILRIARNIKK